MQKAKKKEKLGRPQGIWTFIITDEVTGATRTVVKENIVPDIAFQAMMDAFLNQSVEPYGANPYIAVGDGASSPTAGSVKLGNELVRKTVSVIERVAVNVVRFTVFFNATEVNGILREYGYFANGLDKEATPLADSGVIYSHVGQVLSLSETETLTIVMEFTLSRDENDA